MDDKVIVSGIQLRNGVETTSKIIAQIFLKLGLNVMVSKDYLSTIDGGNAGTTYYQIRVGDGEIKCAGDEIASVLVCLQHGKKEGELPLAATNYLEKIRDCGFLIYDSSKVGLIDPSTPAKKIFSVPVPAYDIVKKLFPEEDQIKVNRIRNSVLVGAMLFLLGLDSKEAEYLAAYGKFLKKSVLEQNLAALREAFRIMPGLQNFRYWDGVSLRFSKATADRMLIDGNNAMAISALGSGVKAYVGYPITPASGLLEAFTKVLPATIQAEDEIAAAEMVMGLSYGGARALTATSGPGFCLMAETISHMGMLEIGCVIIDAQRAGPSTGMPTKTEQSDLNLAIYGHNGDIPKIVLAPGDIGECFEIIPRAFYLAEKYQLPVIILTSLELAEGLYTVTRFDLSILDRYSKALPGPKNVAPVGSMHPRFLRNQETGICEVALPGTPGRIYNLNGSEHDIYGNVTTNREIRIANMSGRLGKMDTFLKNDYCPPTVCGNPKPKIALVGWGDVKGVLFEARDILEKKGVDSRAVHFVDVWPLDAFAIYDALRGPKEIFVIEGNATGQFADLMRQQLAVGGFASLLSRKRFHKITRFDGRPIEPRYITERVIRTMGGDAE